VIVSPARTVRTREPDEACAEAVDLARAALAAVVGAASVGEHLEVQAEGERVATHVFVCEDPAYAGWRWAVTVARAPRAKAVTVDETVLLPGPEALLAPAWVPWQDRLRPGDLGVGDLLPAPPDDERLVPLVLLEGDDAVTDWYPEGEDIDPAEPPGWWLVAGRSRVLSGIGRDGASARWYTANGPRTPLAHAAPAQCVSCGFFVPISGELGQLFGACANAYAPDDGRVVSADHGCGAHSESVVWQAAGRPIAPVIDELGYDLVELPGVSVEETVFEPLDLSRALSAAFALARLSLGTYHSPNRPKASPVTHVQIHHRALPGRLSRTISRTTSAMVHPAVTTPMTSWSLASSGGGGAGRSARSRVCSTRSGYEVPGHVRVRWRTRAAAAVP
jgi:Protein of unknown function (DUF3027)